MPVTDLLDRLGLARPVVPPGSAQARTAIIWPVPTPPLTPPPVVEGPLVHDSGDVVAEGTLRPRLCAFLGPGSTLAGVAVELTGILSRITARTTSAPVPDADDLCQALLTYTAPYLGEDWAVRLRAGLRLPLPVEIDEATGTWVTNLDSIRTWRDRRPATGRAALHAIVPPVPAEDPTALRLSVAAQVGEAGDVAQLSGPLTDRLLRNPFEALPGVLEVLHRVRQDRPTDEPRLALAMLDRLVPHQIQVLAWVTAGNTALHRLWAALTVPAAASLPAADQTALTAAQRLLADGLGLSPVSGVPDAWLDADQATPTVVPHELPSPPASPRPRTPAPAVATSTEHESSNGAQTTVAVVDADVDPGRHASPPGTEPKLTIGGLLSTAAAPTPVHGVVDAPVPFAGHLAAIFTGGLWIHVDAGPRYAVADNLRRATMWGHTLWGGRSYLVLEGFPDTPAPFLVLPVREDLSMDRLDWTQGLAVRGAPVQLARTYFWRETWRDAAGRQYRLRLIAPIDGSQAPPPAGRVNQLDPPRFLFPLADLELVHAEWEAFAGVEATIPAADVRRVVFEPLWKLAGEGDITRPGMVDLERAAGRLSELDATAFAILRPDERAHYANVLSHAFTTQARERAIVELFKTAEDRPALNRMIGHLTPDDHAKVFRDLDYELWSLFIAVGERFPPTEDDLTLDDLLDLVFALWPELHTVITRTDPAAPPALALDQLDELYVAAGAALKFVVDTFEGVFQLITEPDKLIEGVWQLIKLALTAQLALPPISDPQAIQYMAALFTLLGEKVRAAYRGAIALGAVEHTLIQVKWTILWEVASWFIGVGEVRAGLQGFRGVRELVESWAALARPAKLAVDAVAAAEKATVTTKLAHVMKLLNAKTPFGTDTDLLRALDYVPDSDTARIAKSLENLDTAPIAGFDDLPAALKADLLRLRQRLDALKPMEQLLGPLSENGRAAFKRLADHHMLVTDTRHKRLSRLMAKLAHRDGKNITTDQWEAFAAAVNKLPPQAFAAGPGGRDLNFLLRLSRQPDACLLIARETGYAAFAVLWDHSGQRFDSLNALLRRLNKLVAEVPSDQQAARHAEILQKVAQKDQQTIKAIEDFGRPVAKIPVGGAAKTLDQLKLEAVNTPPGPAFKAFRAQLDAYPDYKGSVGETWLRKWVFGSDPNAGKRVYVYPGDNPSLGEEMLALERSADAFTSPATGRITWWDGKVYGPRTDIDPDQAYDNELFEGANQVMVRFQKHDPTGPPPAEPPTPVVFEEIGYIFFDIKAAKRNRTAVQTDASGEVYYLDELGDLQHLD